MRSEVLRCLHALFVQCILHPGSTRGRPSITVHTHASTCLACECALEYLIAFPSISIGTELTSKPRRHDGSLSTADLFVKQLYCGNYAGRGRRPAGQLVVLHSCLLPLTGELRGKQPRGRSGQVTRRPGAVASQGKEKCF